MLTTQTEVMEYILTLPDETCVGVSCFGAEGSINEGVRCPFVHPDRAGCRQPPPGRLAAFIERTTPYMQEHQGEK